MSKQVFQWDAGTIEVQPPEGAPEGCPPVQITLGTITATWGEDDPLPPATNWSAFRLGLEDNVAFKKVFTVDIVVASMMMLTVERLHALSSQAYLLGLAEVARQWNKLVAGLETPLTQEEIDTLNTLGTTNNVPFALDAQGLLGAGQ